MEDEEGLSIYLDDDKDDIRNTFGVAAETEDYMRTAIVYTHEVDYFIDIGCNVGVLVDFLDCRLRLVIDKL